VAIRASHMTGSLGGLKLKDLINALADNSGNSFCGNYRFALFFYLRLGDVAGYADFKIGGAYQNAFFLCVYL
jgi:hypothetical protein